MAGITNGLIPIVANNYGAANRKCISRAIWLWKKGYGQIQGGILE